MKATKRAHCFSSLWISDHQDGIILTRYSTRCESMDYSAKELRETLPDVTSKERADSLVKNYHTSNGVR